MPARYFIRTLGCKANTSDSRALEAELQRRGWLPASNEQDPDIHLCIVNSCTVTDEAEYQSRKAAERLYRKNRSARVVVTGCSVEVDAKSLSRSKGIHYLVGNRNKPEMARLLIEAIEKEAIPPKLPVLLGQNEGDRSESKPMLSKHEPGFQWPAPGLIDEPITMTQTRTRAFVKVQEGCDSFCTYCIIPYGRGPSRSLKIDQVVTGVQGLVERGIREAVITGTNIGDYGKDWAGSPQLVTLCERIFSETALERLRLSSLDPTEITDGLVELMAREARFCRHFHVSVQSVNSRILRLMKRRYTFENVKECLERIARLNAFVGLDLITGFPGESKADFVECVSRLEGLPWSRLHVFPYSERADTPATRLPGSVPKGEKSSRAQALSALSLSRLNGHYSGILKRAKDSGLVLRGVLMENPCRGPDGTRQWVAGYTPHYIRVLVPSVGRKLHNQIMTVRPERIMVDLPGSEITFLGKLIESAPRSSSHC